MNDLTILIQGRPEEEQLNLWIENYKDYKVIISVWDDFNLDIQFPSNWKIVKNSYPERYGTHVRNLDLQIESTLAGLKEVDTKYVLKVRCDEYWSKIEKIYNKMITDDSKLLCGSMFFRPIGLYSFHISDHIICGTVDNMKFLFESGKKVLIYDLWRYTVPECILGFGYIGYKESFNFSNIGQYIDYPEVQAPLLKKYFHIIDVNELSPFICTEKDPNPNNPNGRVWYRDVFGNGNCITEL